MYIKLYFIALPVFFAIDMVWLGLVAKNLYFTQLGSLIKTDINWAAAIIFYALFIVGLVFFVIAPSVGQHSLRYAVSCGALFGLITYATYDLTNLATLKDWPLMISIVDMAWGAVLAGTVSGASYIIASWIGI